MAKPVLGYWDVRGLAEPTRLLLEHCAVDYEEKRYQFGKAPNYLECAWFEEKFDLGLDFPNIPYYMDGDVKLTESLAIIKFIARKNGLAPVTESEIEKCEMVEGVATGLRQQFGLMCYLPEFEKNKVNFFDNALPGKLALFEKYLEKNKWIAGDRLTYVDFVLAEYLDQFFLMNPASGEKFKNVSAYLNRFFEMEKIAAYRQSKRFKPLPVNGVTAHWGGKAEE